MSVENIRELRCDRCGEAVTLRSHEDTPTPWGQLTVLRGFRGDQSDDLCTACVDSLKLWFSAADQPPTIAEALPMEPAPAPLALGPTAEQHRAAVGIVIAQMRAQVASVLELSLSLNLPKDAAQPFPMSYEGIEERAQVAVDTLLMLFEPVAA
ncbi:hypothetical protein LWE61_14895 [Sphingobium sufflavum]|uniref:hypothetical protein n=1 Tax=Sphingobium sufflavum TaxID=1129547 RepID=UPI001F304250|nr:hypothetical protein [Sphingobium sufflavum]MCE7797837.1 hypothetical protein [Sphingobium sufflavum]